MITHHTEPDGTLVIRVDKDERKAEIAQAMAIAVRAARLYGVSPISVLGQGRASDAVDARGMAMHLSRRMLSLSGDELVRLYNKRGGSSTVRRALQRCERMLQVEPAFARRYEALRAAVIADGKEARSA